MNSCRVIFPSWSLSMRLKKSMTRDFLWFIQRMYFFLHTSKSKLANSFSYKTRSKQRLGVIVVSGKTILNDLNSVTVRKQEVILSEHNYIYLFSHIFLLYSLYNQPFLKQMHFIGGLGYHNQGQCVSRKGNYLLQPIQCIVELPLAIEGQQPNLLPPGTELVEPRVTAGNLHGRVLLLLLLLLLVPT